MAWLPRKFFEKMQNPSCEKGDVSRMFQDFFGRMEMPSPFGGGEFAPAVDVVETKDSILVKAEIPGIDPKELDITITGDLLTIKGEKNSEREEKGKNFHRIERSSGSFSRTVQIPSHADTSKVSAGYKDGVLTVTLSKREEAKSKSIKVEFK
jgi:HSP20 family protein